MHEETSFDVYVSEGALLEVTRGQHLTVAQAFGEEWNGAPMVNVHSQGLGAVTSQPAMATRLRPSPRPERGFWTVAAIAFVLVCWFLIWVSR